MRDLNKLPVWAQTEIKRLKKRVAELEETLTNLAGEPSKVIVNPYSERPFFLPDYSAVLFNAEIDQTMEPWLVVQRDSSDPRRIILDIGLRGVLVPFARNRVIVTWLRGT